MDTIRAQATILCTFLAMAVATWQLWQVARKRRRNPINWSPLITALPMLSLALLSDRVSEPVDRYLHLNNFSWYLGYSLGVLTCAIVVVLGAQEEALEIRQRVSRTFVILGASALLGMAIIYVMSMRDSPEWVSRQPRNLTELIFSLAFFVYGSLITYYGLRHVIVIIRRELNPVVRIRLQIGYGSYITAHLFFVCKSLYLFLSYQLGGFLWLNHLALLLMAITGWIWVVGNLPAAAMRYLIRYNPVRIYRELQLLRDLEGLNRELQKFVPSLLPARRTWIIDKFRDRSLHIYRTTIAILDAKKILTDYVTQPVETRAKYPQLRWSAEQEQNAFTYYLALQALDGTPGDTLTSVTSTLQAVARKLRTSA